MERRVARAGILDAPDQPGVGLDQRDRRGALAGPHRGEKLTHEVLASAI